MLGKLIKGLVLLAAVGVAGNVQARRAERIIKSEKGFLRTISRRPFVVAYFYDECKDTSKGLIAQMHSRRNALDRAVSTLSGLPDYKEGDLFFLKINVGRSDLADVARQYGVKNMPAFLLFKYGTVMLDENNSPLTLFGPDVDGVALKDFIEVNLGDDITERIEQKEIDQARRDLARAYYWNYWGPYNYYGYGYPYYSGYPYGRIGFGVSI